MECCDLASLTETELAELLGVDRRTIRRLHKLNEMPAHGDGRSRRFNWNEVREWYLLYRVGIALRGGRQIGSLRDQISQIRKQAASIALRKASAIRDEQEARRRDRQALLERKCELRSGVKRLSRRRNLRRG